MRKAELFRGAACCVLIISLSIGPIGCHQGRNPLGEVQTEDDSGRRTDIQYRESRAIEAIMDVLGKHSAPARVNVEARFAPSGKLLNCEVEVRESVPFSRSGEKDSIVREICAIVEKLGSPSPPPSLSFEIAFSTPLVLPDS